MGVTASPRVKRFRDPLSPQPVLDRAALLRALKVEGIVLKPGQLDAFYQLLHRRGYPPLKEFAQELRGEAGASGEPCGGGAGVVLSHEVRYMHQNRICAAYTISWARQVQQACLL